MVIPALPLNKEVVLIVKRNASKKDPSYLKKREVPAPSAAKSGNAAPDACATAGTDRRTPVVRRVADMMETLEEIEEGLPTLPWDYPYVADMIQEVEEEVENALPTLPLDYPRIYEAEEFFTSTSTSDEFEELDRGDDIFYDARTWKKDSKPIWTVTTTIATSVTRRNLRMNQSGTPPSNYWMSKHAPQRSACNQASRLT
ncbi:hypothetical protein B0H16DRAFT_1475744 [Mycena metata]|uniref:Uncharacterized protein n=1 Tax=Mycena metata TaxID=1033252 RepID=A0AAD7MHT5_9AGAR|nr:hypothetical protein B0H16DRAFT_1475744 [Mycena metata]